MLFQLRHSGKVGPVEDQGGLILGGPEPGQDAPHRGAVERHDRRQPAQDGTERVGGGGEELDGVSRLVLGDALPVAVVDGAPGRQQGDLTQPVLLGLEPVILVAHHLGAKEGAGEQQEGHRQHPLRDERPVANPFAGEAAHASIRIANQSRKRRRRIRPAAAVESACNGAQTRSPEESWPDGVPLASSTMALRSHTPPANRPALTRRLSGKNTARPQAAIYATTVWASAPAPNAAGVSTSLASPTRNPATAAQPGRLRTATSMRAQSRKSGAARPSKIRGRM